MRSHLIETINSKVDKVDNSHKPINSKVDTKPDSSILRLTKPQYKIHERAIIHKATI